MERRGNQASYQTWQINNNKMVWCGIIIQHQHLSYKLISHFNYSLKAEGCLWAVFSLRFAWFVTMYNILLLVIFVNFQKCKKYATLRSIKLRIKYKNLKISHKISWEMDSKLNQLPTSFCLTIGPESSQCYPLHMLLPCHSVFCSIWILDRRHTYAPSSFNTWALGKQA